MVWVVLLASLVVMAFAAARAPARAHRLNWLIGAAALAACVASLRFGARAWAVIVPLAAWLLWRALVSGAPREAHQGRPTATGMTRAEALRVLGLEEGASPAQVAAAHRSLIKKVHPDQGGSGFLAQQVNEAKKVLDARKF